MYYENQTNVTLFSSPLYTRKNKKKCYIELNKLCLLSAKLLNVKVKTCRTLINVPL